MKALPGFENPDDPCPTAASDSVRADLPDEG